MMFSKLGGLQPQNVNRSPLDPSLHVHHSTRSITASMYISKLTRSRYGATVVVTWHLKGFPENERFWLLDHRKKVRGYAGVPSREEPHKLLGSMKAWQDWMGPRAGKHRLCMSYNEMMSTYCGVSQIYTHCSLVDHGCSIISARSVSRSVSVIPVTPYATFLPATAKQNYRGG